MVTQTREEHNSPDLFDFWREQGKQAILHNSAIFRILVNQAKTFAQRRQYATAVAYAEMAAQYATGKHCGLFVSPELEAVLNSIGQACLADAFPQPQPARQKPLNRILHVATEVMSIGGHSKMLYRWMQQDGDRHHSLALTQQQGRPIPTVLQECIDQRQGQIYRLDEADRSDPMTRAKQLRHIANDVDCVVLHVYNFDIIPAIAFANKENSPPILLVNHADHLFWLGAAITDVVVNLRESGMRLSQDRRGIEPARNQLLPIILDPLARTLSRADAKQKINIPEGSLLMLSLARAVKYNTIDGTNFIEAHLPLIQKYPHLFLLVVGPGYQEEWTAAIEQGQGRIQVLSETENPQLFFQAADIYVDSFPFISITSLLEAGSYELPLVSRHFFSEASAILGADTPGFAENLIRPSNLAEYRSILSTLIENQESRLAIGQVTAQKIIETHTGQYWLNALQKLYDYAISISPNLSRLNLTDTPSLTEPDLFIPLIFDWGKFAFYRILQPRLTRLPFTHRLPFWFELIKFQGFKKFHFSLFLPNVLYTSLRSSYWQLRTWLNST